MPDLHVSTHPLVHHHLTTLRDHRTAPPEFRRAVRILAGLLAQEATAGMATEAGEVVTPLGPSPCRRLVEPLMIVPILRAGLGMAEALLELIPAAEVWHLGMFRDETTLKPTEYYNKLPPRCHASLALVVDPMLATGGSAVHACELLRRSGVRHIKLIALIAAPEGIARLHAARPEVPIHVGAVDPGLNAVGFIDPGLGDAGDRQFGTGYH
jgi:uracil phosphoribosyltransferase